MQTWPASGGPQQVLKSQLSRNTPPTLAQLSAPSTQTARPRVVRSPQVAKQSLAGSGHSPDKSGHARGRPVGTEHTPHSQLSPSSHDKLEPQAPPAARPGLATGADLTHATSDKKRATPATRMGVQYHGQQDRSGSFQARCTAAQLPQLAPPIRQPPPDDVGQAHQDAAHDERRQ